LSCGRFSHCYSSLFGRRRTTRVSFPSASNRRHTGNLRKPIVKVVVPQDFHGAVSLSCTSFGDGDRTISVGMDGHLDNVMCPKSQSRVEIQRNGKSVAAKGGIDWERTGDDIPVAIRFTVPLRDLGSDTRTWLTPGSREQPARAVTGSACISERRSPRRASWHTTYLIWGPMFPLIRSATIPLLWLTTRQNCASECKVRKRRNRWPR
jgi:hypothetical protein